MKSADGWLLDLYPERSDMVLWFMLESGERLRLTEPFAPSFFIDIFDASLPESEIGSLLRAIGSLASMKAVGPAERTDFWTGEPRRVLEVRVLDMNRHDRDLKALSRRWPVLSFYNCDILPEVLYNYHTGLFPTARCRIEFEDGRLCSCAALDRRDDPEYRVPPLREALLTAEEAHLKPVPHLRSLTLRLDERTMTWDGDEPEEMLRSMSDALNRFDPDLLWTCGGDTLLMPVLFSMAAKYRIDLRLDREPNVNRRLPVDGRTYVSYGQVLYHAPDYPLFGRWHIDRDNCFWSREGGLEGLVEVARMSKLPVQRAARRSIGTGISSIQLDFAYRHGVLIPWKKSHPEAWKSAAQLLQSDRGGLVYQPLTGVYEDVIELDFVSMYPTIMARRNVSPETVNCCCCPPSPDVPQVGYTLCKKREGLVSRALEPIVTKRSRFKELMKETRDPERRKAFDGRQGALKWLLVCCFGYLGYRNARFGRIEAHESTCAFSRELLMRAKEAAEERGFTVLHAIVDCLWLRRDEKTEDQEVAALCDEIERATGLRIAVEGRYRWLAFLPSRQHAEMPVPNRYFGCFTTGKLKYRGIEARRGDQAPFVQRLQLDLLECLAAARTLEDCRAMKRELAEMVLAAEFKLREREVDLHELVLRRKTSMTAEEYRSNGMTALAARQARQAGIPLHAGEAVHFIVTSAGDRDLAARLRLTALWEPHDSYDAPWYVEQLRRAAATILEPLLGESLEAILGEKKKGLPLASCRQLELFTVEAWG